MHSKYAAGAGQKCIGVGNSPPRHHGSPEVRLSLRNRLIYYPFLLSNRSAKDEVIGKERPC